MQLTLRLIFIVAIVVSVTDVVEYFHLKKHPEHLTIPYLISVIFITILPVAVIFLYWHSRNWI
jgi:heme/copper-type cytochrome/quinol oxidase subunit 4